MKPQTIKAISSIFQNFKVTPYPLENHLVVSGIKILGSSEIKNLLKLDDVVRFTIKNNTFDDDLIMLITVDN